MGMVGWGMQVSAGQPNETVGDLSLPDVQNAFAALVSPDPHRRAQLPDRFQKAFEQSTRLCAPNDDGVLWFASELLRFIAKSAVEEFSVATTAAPFPGRAPGDLEEAMYLMLGLDVLAGQLIRRCRNPRCHHSPFFTPDDSRQHFCCEVCGNADRANRHRREQREGKRRKGP
jgi:hypothetical protein